MFRDMFVRMEYALLVADLTPIVLLNVHVKTENVKILAMHLMCLVVKTPNVTSPITELFACAQMDSKENQILNASDILVITMMIVRRIRSVVPKKYAKIHVWNKVLVDQMLNAGLQTEWLFVHVRLDIMEMLNLSANQVNII